MVSQGTKAGRKEREWGIDLLRMVSMFMIPVLHVLGKGGILNNCAPLSMHSRVAWLLEIGALCSVNCFALVSGYVGGQSKFRCSKLLKLWLQVIFYSVGITALTTVLRPDLVPGVDWIYVLFPVSSNCYWYITAYFGLSIFTPLLNKILEITEKKQLTFFVLNALILFSILNVAFRKGTGYGLSGGYSTLWLMILYLTGGYIKKYDLTRRISKKLALTVYVVSTLLTWGGRVILEKLTFQAFGEVRYCEMMTKYITPTIVLNALALLCFFANLKITSGWLRAVIKVLSPAALGVYLIHTQKFIWQNIIQDCAIPLLNLSPVLMAFGVLGIALAIYVICTLVELLRIQLFRILRISSLCDRIDRLLH